MGHVLAGDIGGTRARFALFDPDRKRVVHQEVFASRSMPTFEAALGRYLEGDARRHLGRSKLAAASFGIAGPVVEQRVRATNLPWTIDGREVARTFGIARVTLLNDLVAVGLGALAAPPSKLAVLQVGRPKKRGGNLAVIAAGTGLGEASFVWDGERHVACATEGGHTDFGPRSALEAELREELSEGRGHVSYEDVVAGSKIAVLYRFLQRDKRIRESKDAAARVARAEDPNVAVVELAEQRKSEVAVRAIELWTSIYGAEAGNLALKCLAAGGVFVAGGVSTRLAPVLARGLRGGRGSPFLEAFVDKGPMRPLLEKVPVAVVLETRAGLLGAAAHAASVARK